MLNTICARTHKYMWYRRECRAKELNKVNSVKTPLVAIYTDVYMYILIYVEAKRLCFVLACNAIVVIYFFYLFHNFWTLFNGNRKLRNDKNILIATDIESICTVHALSHTYSDNVNKIVYYWCHEIAHLTEPNRTEHIMNRNFWICFVFHWNNLRNSQKLVTFAIVSMDICGIEMKTTITNYEWNT